MSLESLEEVKKYNLNQIEYNVHKSKEVFIDTINFAIDKDSVKHLYTLLILENFHEKVGKFRGDLINLKKKTTGVETIIKEASALLDLIVMLGVILEKIKFELSCMAIRKKYDLSSLLVNNNELMTDGEKINHMMILIQHGLNFEC